MNCSVCGQQNAEGARFCQSCGAPITQPNADPSDLVGQLIGGRYIVKRVIGEGGMGVVYEAEQRMGAHSRKVAIKTLLPELSNDHTIVSRFYRECGIVAQLEHPNTIRFYDFGETPDKRLYIAMEFVRGESLSDLIARGPVAMPRVRRILRQICGALGEAHGLGIIHRDLKPDNIILTNKSGEEDFVKVLDFGIAARTEVPQAGAKPQTKLTQQGVVLGTPPYMSPEQLAGQKLDGRSDIYSLGVIAYEMITGRLPFEASSPWEWASKHMTVSPPPMRTVTAFDIPLDLERAVLHALSKTPGERPATVMDFARELLGETRADPYTEPDYGSPRPRTSPMDAQLAFVPPVDRGTQVNPHVSPVVQAQVPHYPPIRTGAAVAAPIPFPPPRSRRGSGAGLWLALGGLLLGGVLFVAAFIAFQQQQGGGSGGETPLIPINSPSSTTEITPLGTQPETPPPPTTEPTQSDPPPNQSPTKPPTQPTKPPTQPTTPPTQPTTPPTQPTTPPTQPTTPPTTPPPPSGPQGDAACAASEAAARGGSIEGAVAMYNKCQSTGGSPGALSAARARIRSQAPSVVKNRAFRGDCPGAKSAANAASSIGENGGQAALATTSCK